MPQSTQNYNTITTEILFITFTHGRHVFSFTIVALTRVAVEIFHVITLYLYIYQN